MKFWAIRCEATINGTRTVAHFQTWRGAQQERKNIRTSWARALRDAPDRAHGVGKK